MYLVRLYDIIPYSLPFVLPFSTLPQPWPIMVCADSLCQLRFLVVSNGDQFWVI